MKHINMVLLYDCKGDELWLMLIIHIISKRNDSVNIIILCTLHDVVFYLFILFTYLLGLYILKLLVEQKYQ